MRMKLLVSPSETPSFTRMKLFLYAYKYDF